MISQATQESGFRPIAGAELEAVSGGVVSYADGSAQEREAYMAGRRAYTAEQSDTPATDSDELPDDEFYEEDGVPTLVITGGMSDQEKMAYDHWHAQATTFIDSLIYGSVMVTGGAGFAGRLGAAAGAGTTALAMERTNLINYLSDFWYEGDRSDGQADGQIGESFEPGGTYWGVP